MFVCDLCVREYLCVFVCVHACVSLRMCDRDKTETENHILA